MCEKSVTKTMTSGTAIKQNWMRFVAVSKGRVGVFGGG